jgi:MoCo/4Fe-4S cofactor protein with predicted Tat translocation signal
VSAEYWRSLGELEDSPESRAFREREFPEGASEAPDAVSRRTLLQLLGATVGATGLAACRHGPVFRRCGAGRHVRMLDATCPWAVWPMGRMA